MGFFNTFGRGNSFGSVGNLFHSGPSTYEKVEMLFTDVETEGKKQGYQRAVKEYESAYDGIRREYQQAKDLIANQKNAYGQKSDDLIGKLEELERQKKSLQRQVDEKTDRFSVKYHVSSSSVRSALASNSLIGGSENGLFGDADILDVVYSYKKGKMEKAEQRGYQEAKAVFEEKIAALKRNLDALRTKGDAELREMVDMIGDILDEIAQTKMQIADLNLLL